MRKLIPLLLLIPFLFACEKPQQDISFYLPVNSEATIPAGTGINLPFNLVTPNIESNSQAAFNGNNTSASLVKSISLATMTLELISPSGEDFSFLDEITVYISAEDLPESEIASLINISPDSSLIELNTTGLDLKQYVVKDKFDMRIKTSTDEILGSEHKLEIKSRFLVEASLLN